MMRSEAGKLLGGHATGTLTEAERRRLFAAALESQELFDALMDEEALRELLADPAAKAQLLAALAPAAAPKVVPFWRRTGVLGAAASLLVASLAGIVYLRSPEKAPPTLEREAGAAPKAKVAEAPAAAQAPLPMTKKVPPASPAQATISAPPAQAGAANPAPPPPEPMAGAAASAPAVAGGLRAREQDLYRRAEAQDKLAKKAEAPRPSAALMEAASAPKAEKQKGGAESRNAQAGAIPGGLTGGVVSGVVGGMVSPGTGTAQDGRSRDAAPPPAAPAPAKAARRVEGKAATAFAPTWTVEPQNNGTTRVLVKGPAGAHAVLLRRSAASVEVLALRIIDPGAEMTRWAAETRLAEGVVLDLYLLNAPVADPAKLPETGPVDGFRARIHPAVKKIPVP